MLRQAPLGFRALALLLALTAGHPALADDGWNPFEARDRERARARARQQPETPPAEALPPMDGISSRPWAQPTGPADAAPWRNGPSASPGMAGPNGQPPTAPPTAVVPIDRVERVELSQPPPLSAPPTAAPPAFGAAPGPGPSPSTPWQAAARQPDGFWTGLDVASAGRLVAEAQIPPRSSALHEQWRRLWNGEAGQAPAPASGGPGFSTLRTEALYRSGLIADLARSAAAAPASPTPDPAEQLLAARARIALGDAAGGCPEVKSVHRAQAKLPKALRADLILLAGLCGTAARDPAAAGLAAELMRAEQVDAPAALAGLDALAAGRKVSARFDMPKSVSLIDYRFLEQAGYVPAPEIVAAAEPALLAVLAASAAEPQTRILAAEAAARLHAIAPADLAAAYRAQALPPEASADPLSANLAAPLKRALLFKMAEAEGNPQTKARLMRALLDEARRAETYTPTAAMLAVAVANMLPSPEIGWFAETAIEINLAAGRYDVIELWAAPQRAERHAGLRHWLVLADIADPQWRGRRGANLVHAEEFAVRGRLAPELMHRLVTVLDALDYQIPIPLWEAASRTPQPTTGHLPATGILSEMQAASKAKEQARTILLALRSLGPDTAANAHMIALGDTIKALKRAGLEPSARRLGLEALFLAWPRMASH